MVVKTRPAVREFLETQSLELTRPGNQIFFQYSPRSRSSYHRSRSLQGTTCLRVDEREALFGRRKFCSGQTGHQSEAEPRHAGTSPELHRVQPSYPALHINLPSLPDVQAYDHADERHVAQPLAEPLAGAGLNLRRQPTTCVYEASSVHCQPNLRCQPLTRSASYTRTASLTRVAGPYPRCKPLAAAANPAYHSLTALPA